MAPHLYLRAEVKPHEHRTALTPEVCKTLIEKGYQISVEKSFSKESTSERCIPDSEYVAAGCTLVESETWKNAPADAYIVGLKELPEDGCDLQHKHIYFGHAYKHQAGWRELLGRFTAGGGSLLDLEFLQDDRGRRVAAFGYMAGFAGAFVAVDAWCQQVLSPGEKLGLITPYPNEDALLKYGKERLAAAIEKAGTKPKIIVMGALGRCGTGACDMASKLGFTDDQISKWDMEETKKGGPFPAILEHEIFVNCIYLAKPIPQFITTEMLSNAARAMTVVCDVSCDTTNPHNPLPFCNKPTTFVTPTFEIAPVEGKPLDIIAIDHLPTLLPKESSEMFAKDLLPTMLNLTNSDTDPVWQRASKLFDSKVEEMTTSDK